MPTRRDMLGMTAAVPVLALLGGCTEGPDVAEAWRDPGKGESDIRRWALAHAILTPNPHNKQPWLVQLVGTDGLILRPDLTRLLPATDPFNRQITVGCGAFLELLGMAAAEKGWRVDGTLWPEGEPQPRLDSRPIAAVRFVRDATVKPHALFRHVLARRTNRTVYDVARTPTASALAALVTAERPLVKAGASADPAQRDRLRALTATAFLAETDAPAPHHENVINTRIGDAEIGTARDGLVLSGMMIEIGNAVGLVTREKFLDRDSIAFGQFRSAGQPWADSSMAFAWLSTATNSRTDQIEAGRAYLHMALLAVREGLAVQPMSQGLQEYPEMAAILPKIEQELGVVPPGRVQMLVRLGYADPVPPAPRRGLAPILVA